MIAILYWNDPLEESSILASALQATRSGASLQQCQMSCFKNLGVFSLGLQQVVKKGTLN